MHFHTIFTSSSSFSSCCCFFVFFSNFKCTHWPFDLLLNVPIDLFMYLMTFQDSSDTNISFAFCSIQLTISITCRTTGWWSEIPTKSCKNTHSTPHIFYSSHWKYRSSKINTEPQKKLTTTNENYHKSSIFTLIFSSFTHDFYQKSNISNHFLKIHTRKLLQI